MKKLSIGILLLCVAASASAQFGPPVPTALEVAAIPGLSGDQQAGVRKILLQRRDAVEALMIRQHADFDALRQKERGERERIDDTTAVSLRKLLGDDGLHKFAEWHAAQRDNHGPRPEMQRGAGPGRGMRHDGHDAPPPTPNAGSPAPGLADDDE
ncbi:MAG: hypothetical protein ABI846_14260 [Rudaea sp.]